MNKNRLIFYVVFAAFHVGAFIFTLFIEDFSFLTRIYKHIALFKWITLFGIILIVIDVVWAWTVSRDSQKQTDALTHELNTLKAKLFDLQEIAKESEVAKNTPKSK